MCEGIISISVLALPSLVCPEGNFCCWSLVRPSENLESVCYLFFSFFPLRQRRQHLAFCFVFNCTSCSNVQISYREGSLLLLPTRIVLQMAHTPQLTSRSVIYANLGCLETPDY